LVANRMSLILKIHVKKMTEDDCRFIGSKSWEAADLDMRDPRADVLQNCRLMYFSAFGKTLQIQ
jgi:hypothetical protein